MLPRRAAALFLFLASALSANDVKVVEEIPLFTDQPAAGIQFRVWNMTEARRDGHLYLNEDCKGEPWAGVSLFPQEKGKTVVTLTDEWIKFGFLRYRINGLADPYGACGPPCKIQVRLMGAGRRYHRVRERFFASGDGIDSDPDTWQEVLVPVAYFDPKPGDKVTAVSLQCVGKPTRAFAVDQVSLVRYSGERRAERDEMARSVAQPWVTWPAYADLPPTLQVENIRPYYRDEKFVTADGRRTFLISPWGREDQRGGLGYSRDGRLVSNYGLYDPKTQGFIYEQPLVGESMARLGFNSFANLMHPDPFWKAVGYKGKHSFTAFPDEAFREHVARMKLPFFVDMVCFPWTLGKPGLDKNTSLPPEALHDGHEHWTPYRIIGKGRDIWLTMWRTYAQRYKDAGAQVIFYEFMNEPAYLATTPDHRAEFIDWLKQRYGKLERVNRMWGTSYASWEDIRNFKSVKDNAGVFFDYDEYLGDRFADLIAEGRRAVEEITPDVPAAIQCMGNYCLQPRDAIYLSKLIPIERAVLTPTGGGRWTRHLRNDGPKARVMDYGMSESPIANDLLLAMAGPKMIVDNEMYLGPKQTREDMRNRWWKAVTAGLDGSAWFSWSKRGWAWWKGKENIRREADLFPYSALIPYARRADAIRGTLEFAREIELVREYVLPKPWGPPAKVGLIYSWANARWRNWDRQLQNKAGDYHAAMRYLHWNFDVIPSHMADKQTLQRYRLLVAGGIDHVEPELVDALRDYAARGGALVVGEGLLGRDLYDKPVATERLLGVKRVGAVTEALGRIETNSRYMELPEFPAIPGEITSRAGGVEVEPTVGACKVLWVDAKGRSVVTCNAFGDGKVYYVAADLVGYRLAKLLGWIRTFEGIGSELTVRDAATEELAPNVLVSRRSYEKHHALLLMNMDEFPKHVCIRVGDLSGDWHVSDPLEGRAFLNTAGKPVWTGGEIAKGGIPYCITGENRGLLLLTREPWSKTKLASATTADLATVFKTELGLWKQGREKTSAPLTMDPSRAGYVDLRATANATREDVVANAKERWQGFPSTEPLVRTFAGIPFRIIRWDHNDMKGYVALRSAATPQHPAEVRGIKVGSTAARLFFLAACGDGADGEAVGKVAIRYAGGESVEMPLTIGKTIGRLTDRFEGASAMATGLVTAVGSAWHVTEWKNPKPDVPIESMDLVALPGASGTVVLVAVTLEK